MNQIALFEHDRSKPAQKGERLFERQVSYQYKTGSVVRYFLSKEEMNELPVGRHFRSGTARLEVTEHHDDHILAKILEAGIT